MNNLSPSCKMFDKSSGIAYGTWEFCATMQRIRKTSLIFLIFYKIIGEWKSLGILRLWAIMKDHRFGDLFQAWRFWGSKEKRPYLGVVGLKFWNFEFWSLIGLKVLFGGFHFGGPKGLRLYLGNFYLEVLKV
jgi:hypothetical protein